MARLAQVMINQYPDYYRYFSTKNFSYNGRNYHNHNRLMSSYKGMDGMKTGYTVPSGFNLIASAVRNNQRLIGVVFGGRSASSRNDHMATLLDRAFSGKGEMMIASAAAQNAPLPPRKPAMLLAMDSISKTMSANAQRKDSEPKFAFLNPALDNDDARPIQDGAFEELIGQGDYDPASARRIETGLMAIAAVKGDHTSAARAPVAAKAIQYSHAQRNAYGAAAPATPVLAVKPTGWAVQIGAYSSRAATDQRLHHALKSLPAQYASAQPMIAPLKTQKGIVFRARLGGYTREQALGACRHIKDCLPIAP
jgi:D-alanyl-D-alanine carboxypeptidase